MFQASIMAPVGDVEEDPTFTGAKTNCKKVSDYLTLTFDTFDTFDTRRRRRPARQLGGQRRFGRGRAIQRRGRHGPGLGEALPGDQPRDGRGDQRREYWDAKIGPIDSWQDIDGTLGAIIGAHVWGKVADTAYGSTDWSPIPSRRIDAMEINARSLGSLHLRMISENPSYNLRVTELRLIADQVA